MAFLFLLIFGASPDQSLSCSLRPACLFVQELTRDLLELNPVIEASMNPHHFDLSTSKAMQLSNSKGLIYIDPQLEPWVMSFERLSRFALAEQTDNPHIWLDPVYLSERTAPLAEYLCQIDKPNCSEYMSRAKDLVNRLKSLDKKLKAKFQAYEGKSLIVTHNSFDHFALRYGLQPVSIFLGGHGQDPSSKHLIHIVKKIKAEDIPAVFYELQFSKTAVERLTESTKVKVLSLDPLGQSSTIKTYWDLISFNSSQILKGLENASN